MSDTGDADPRLAAAVAALAVRGSAAARAEVLAAFVAARVFAAVTATSTAEHVAPGTGLRAESSAEMALLTLVGSAGGRAVPLFLDAAAAVAFRSGARPVPLPGGEACAAALQDGAVAVLLDPPGAALALTGGELHELAQGRVPVAGAPLSASRTTSPLTAPAGADPALLRAVAAALATEPVRAARLLQGPDGPVLGVVLDGAVDAAALAALAARVLPRLGRPDLGRPDLGGPDPGWPDRGLLDLAVAAVPPDGPGLPVPLEPARRGRRWRRLRRDR